MKIKKSMNLLGAGVAVAVVAALVAAPVTAMAAPLPPTTTTNPIWLTSSSTTPVLLAPTATPKLNASVYAAKSGDPADRLWDMPAGALHEYEFISARGSEFNRDTWSIFSDPHTDPGAMVNLKVSGFLSENPGKSFDTIGTVGGDFSLGLAFVNASGTVLEANFAHITITPAADANPVNATYTFSTPAAAAVAPVVTTQPISQTAAVGGDVTFTAAASGDPAPTVTWQSAAVATSTWTDIAGATSDSLTVSNVQLANTGTQYRAVYTNSAASVNSNVAVLTVSSIVPTKPTTGTPGELSHVDVAEGASTIVVDTTLAAGTYSAWAWSTPTQLPNAVVDATGDATINVTGLTPGDHTIALTAVGSSTVVAWLTITVPGFPTTAETDLTVDVTTSNKFALEGVAAALDLGSAARGASTSADLPEFTVTDDRNLLPGWDLTSTVDDFVNATAGNDVIGKAALSIEPRKVGAAVAGISAKPVFTVGTSNLFAEGLLNSSTPSTGTKFDAKLTFDVPATAKAGTYESKLTLTLTSK